MLTGRHNSFNRVPSKWNQNSGATNHFTTIIGDFLGSMSSRRGSRRGYCNIHKLGFLGIGSWREGSRPHQGLQVKTKKKQKGFYAGNTSSAMLCRILRCTDALTWFCPDMSSEENLRMRTECKVFVNLSPRLSALIRCRNLV